jgi:hypothetical protein
MHGIDGRWHNDPPLVERSRPVPPQPVSESPDADTQELRFTLQEIFLATTIAAVMLALFRSIGIFGAVFSFLFALIDTLDVIPRLFQKDLPRQRLYFDFVWGIVMPIVCLVFDPFVFKSGDLNVPWEIQPPFSNKAVVSKLQINAFAYYAWPFLAGQIASLGLVLACGKSLRRIAPFLAGVLATGFLAAACLGVLLALPAAMGTLAFGIGLLGFTPIFTSFAFFRRMRLMWHLSRGWTPEKVEFLLALFGILFYLLLTGLIGTAALAVAPPPEMR